MDLTSVVIPDGVTSIGKGAFSNNQLTSVAIPDGVTNIKAGTFCFNQLTSVAIPDSVTNIEDSAFQGNKLTSVVIPDSVTYIGYNAFNYNAKKPLPAYRKGYPVNNIYTYANLIYNPYKSNGDEDIEWVKDDFIWDGDTVLGINYESRSKLDRTSKLIIPNGTKVIGYNAFNGLNLTSVVIPDGVKSIKGCAFLRNQLTSIVIPGSVTNIGNEAFSHNKNEYVTAYIPGNKKSWNESKWETGLDFQYYKATGTGDAEWLEEDFFWSETKIKGLSLSGIKKLKLTNKLVIPNMATEIEEDAFRGANLISVIIPNGVTSIGNNAFIDNKLISVLIPDTLTTIGINAFAGNLGESAVNNKVILNIKDSSNNTVNPNNLNSKENYIINPKQIVINYVNEDGEVLLPKKEIITDKTDTFKVTDIPKIASYKLPANVDIDLSEANKYEYSINVVYKKYTEEELTEIANRTKSMKFKHTAKEDKNYYIGDTMISYIYFDLSGFDADISGYKIRIPFNPDIFDVSKIKVTKANLIKSAVVKEGEIELTIGEAYGGSSLSLPIEWAFNKYKTPANTHQVVTATMYDDKDELYALVEDTKFIGHYNNLNIEKELVGETNGYVVTDDIDENGYLTGNKLLEYKFRVTNVERNIGEYKVVDILPEYRNQNNELVKATFNQTDNPDWKLAEDGNTVTYTGNANNSTNLTIPSLKLRMPGAQSYANIRNTANVEATPYEMSQYEKVLTASDYVTHYFKKPEVSVWTPTPPSPPPAEWTGVAFDKDIRMPHYASSESQAYFYDIDRERNTEFTWALSYNWKGKDVTNISITDKNLDNRMFYYGIKPDSDFVGGKIEAFNKDGVALLSKDITDSEKIIFNEGIAKDIDSIKITKNNHNGTEVSYGRGLIQVYTKLRNTDSTIYDDTPGSKKNVFENTAVADYTLKDGSTISIIDKDNLALRWLTQTIKATKSTTFNDEVHKVKDTGSYDVGCATDSEMIVDEMRNFELIDLLPIGLNVKGIELYEPFNSEPTAVYKIIENYNNSGQTAIVFTADKLKFEEQLNKEMKIARINVEIDDLMPTGTFTNEVFLKVSNPDFKIHNTVEDDRIGEDKYSKALVSNKVLKAEELIARKYIKKASDTYWSTTGIFTDSLEKFEYKLTIFNGTSKDRTNVQIIDILPYVGDTSLTANEKGEYISRESEFANTFDYEKGAQAPEGYEVYYLNTPWKGMTDTMDNLDKALNWEKTPTKDTSAIKLVAKDGVILKGYSQFDVIIPMVAPENSDLSLSGQKAWNTYVRKDTNTIRFIEPNRVYNEMSIPKGSITLTKKGLSDNWKTLIPLAGGTFDLKDSDGNFIKSAKSDTQGIVKFDDIEILKDYIITEREAPVGYVKSAKEIKVSKEDIVKAKNYIYDVGDIINSKMFVPMEPIVGGVKFTKVNKAGEPLYGVRFNIKGQDKWNKDVDIEKVSDKNGNVEFLSLPTGKYIITEINPPKNLQAIEPIVVTIGSMNKTIDLGQVKNEVGEVILTKVGFKEGFKLDGMHKLDRDGQKLQGAEFSIYKGNALIQSGLTTDKNGQVKLSNLETDVIDKLEETKTPKYSENMGLSR